MSTNDVNVPHVGGMDEGTGVIQSETGAHDAHAEYVKEARQLIEDQTATLFATLQQMVATVAEGRPVDVQRDGHTLIARSAATTLLFTVEAITDVPEGGAPAQVFAASQARCLVHAGTTRDTPLDEWVLHRIGAGSAAPPYTWMHVKTEAPVTEDEIVTLLRG